MWPFRSRFRRGLEQEAAQHPVLGNRDRETDKTVSISLHENMIKPLDPESLGRLSALILAQAESDGASRVRLCFGKNGMFYTLDGVEYEMVPPPSVVTVDMVRALAAASGYQPDIAGTIKVEFADRSVEFRFALAGDPNNEYLEITGFTCSLPTSVRVSA